jgi:uncharacterized membrane protein YqaE (UPF0057 family)
MTPRARTWLGAATVLLTLLALALSVPPLRVLIEQGMVWHMLVQMPLLVLAGACAAAAWVPRRERSWNRFGLTGFMLAQCAVAYWMIPATVDRAVVLPSADAAKLVTLWTAGLALGLGYRQAPAPVQLFFIGYALPMMAWLGLYLAHTDLRLCNAYSLQSQLRAGWGLVALAAALGVAWALDLRCGRSPALGSPAPGSRLRQASR